MCGIFGFVVDNSTGFGNTSRNVGDLLSDALDTLAIESQSRGSDASGVAVVTKDFDIGMLKMPMKASEFVKTSEYSEFKEKYLSDKTRILIGHTRAETKGTYRNNFNNHPIHSGNVIGVHNGVIMNDEDLWKNPGDVKQRRGTVDSEVIFHLVDLLTKQADDEIEKGIYRTSVRLNGSFACACFHMQKPKYLWLFTKGNPIFTYLPEALGFRMFASEISIVKKALESVTLGVVINRIYRVRNSSGLRIDASTGKVKEIPLHTKSSIML
jgi:glucosamine--fructose-6-phosphate aminotransferase (isomerizing)